MFLTAHTSIGLLISTKVVNPFIGFILGFISHFIADMIPHGDEAIGIRGRNLTKKQQKIFFMFIGFFDGLGTVTLTYFFINHSDINNIIILSTLLGAWMPDFLWISIEFFDIKFLKWFHKLHQYLHDYIGYRYSVVYGLLFQISLVVLLTYFTLFSFK